MVSFRCFVVAHGWPVVLPMALRKGLSERRLRPVERCICYAQTPKSPDDVPESAWEFMQQLARREGFRVESAASDEEAETWEEAMEEVEDAWMRDPSESSFAELNATSLPLPDAATSIKSVPLITEEDFQAMKAIDNGSIVLLDVRPDAEFKTRRMSEAINIPLELLNAKAVESCNTKTIVVVASGDTKSTQACTRLTKVYKLDAVFHLTERLS